MSAPLTDLAPSALVAAIEANTIGYYLNYRHFAPTEIHEQSDLVWFATGLPIEEFNGVLRADFAPDAADAQIEAVLQQFERRALPLIWHIGPSSRPAELGRLLTAHGLTHVEDEPGMVADLLHIDQPVRVRADLAIEPVRDIDGFRQWLRVWAYGVPDAALEPFVTLYGSLGLGAPHPLQHYLGLVDGVPVATAALFVGAGVASVQHVVTLPELRRQGIGAAMTLHMMELARAAGYRIAVLTASPLGQPTYERLGFRSYCQFSRYCWQPPRAAQE